MPQEFDFGSILDTVGEKKRKPAAQANDGGLDKVATHFRPLGHNRGTYYFFAVRSGQVLSLKASSLERISSLLMLAPLQWWELNFGGDDGFTRGAPMNAAMNWLIHSCNGRGVFEAGRIRGRGAWMDDGRLVFHAGDRLYVDGAVVKINELKSDYIYEALGALPLASDELSSERRTAFFDLCCMPNWTKRQNGVLMAGWCYLAQICGALEWRPHIWLSGSSGSGKSWNLKNIVRPAIGRFALTPQSDTTKAGIAQVLLADARPIVFDEAEAEEEKAAVNIQQVLALMRQSSSEDGGDIYKGGANGEAKTYTTRSMTCLASIAPQIRQTSDENRITVLELNENGSSTASLDAFRIMKKKAEELLTRDFSSQLLKFALDHIGQLKESISILRDIMMSRKGASARNADQFSHLLAGAHMLTSNDVISRDDAEKLVNAIDDDISGASSTTKDHEKLISRLMESQIEVLSEVGSSIRISVGEAVSVARGNPSSEDVIITERSAVAALARRGIKVSDDKREVVISNTHSGLRAMLRGTPWSDGWHRILRRVPGSTASGGVVRFGPVVSRATSVPVGSLDSP